MNPPYQPCRGRELPDGTFAGCAYGRGEITPLIGPCDCEVCHGSGVEGVIASTLPHQMFGDDDCCGCLNGIIRGDVADIECNECGVVVRTVSAADLARTLDEMEASLDVASAMCPHCGAVNLFPGFSEISAYVCRECGRGVTPGPEPQNS